MTTERDYQLGLQINVLWAEQQLPDQSPAVIIGQLQNLLGDDNELLAPIFDLLTRAELRQLLADDRKSKRIEGRDSLLQDLAVTYKPAVLNRLGFFLDGCLNLPEGNVISVPEASQAPADRLRRRLVGGRGRLLVMLSVTLVWLMDLLLAKHLEADQQIAVNLSGFVTSFERLGTYLFIIVTAGLLIALFRSSQRQLFRWGLVYLAFSVVQVLANVLAMVFNAHISKGGGLASLWDVAAVYMESVLVFMFIYIYMDVTTPGGAFVWPSRDGEDPPTPHIIDYLFISLNVNSTYGPTSEALISRSAKLVMALQVLLAMLILTVLISRAVSSTVS